MNAPALKKLVIEDLSYLSLPNLENKNQLLLVTAAGIIAGEIITDSDDGTEESSSACTFAKYVEEIGVNYKKDYNIPNDQWIPGNDGFITLKNVMIRNGSSTVNLPVLTVFFDQIIAASVGKLY